MFQPVTTRVSKNTPAYIRETAEAVFGEKQFLPLATFIRQVGLDRKTVLRLIADGLLDVFQYHAGTYKKQLVSKVSFIRFLKSTSLRDCG